MVREQVRELYLELMEDRGKSLEDENDFQWQRGLRNVACSLCIAGLVSSIGLRTLAGPPGETSPAPTASAPSPSLTGTGIWGQDQLDYATRGDRFLSLPAPRSPRN